MELTPRTGPDSEGGDDAVSVVRGKRRVSLPAMALLVAVVAIAGFVMVKALGSATTFYRNADEAVAQRDSLGVKRFRLQGTFTMLVIRRKCSKRIKRFFSKVTSMPMARTPMTPIS